MDIMLNLNINNYKNTINHLETIILHQDHKSKWKVIDYSYEFVDK